MNIAMTKIKPNTSTKTLPPIYARPGRTDCIKQAISLADEVATTLKAALADDRLRGMAESHRAGLHAELARTVEAPVPKWWRAGHAAEVAQFEALVRGSLPGARNALQQFIDRREFGQAGRYAVALIGLPNQIWADVFRGR